MSIEQLTARSANLLFSFINNISSIACWIRSADYQKQLFVSQGYENIWGRSCQELYEHPENWIDTLVVDDQLQVNQRKQQGNNGTVVFRAKRPDGQIQFVKDQSCTLLSSDGKPIAVIGVGEVINPEHWEALAKSSSFSPSNPGLTDFVGLLQQAYPYSRLAIASNTIENEKRISSYTLSLDGRQVKLTAREYQVLQYLKQGCGAKETARELEIDPRTVETYLNNIRQKTACRNKYVLMSKLIELGQI
jgi:DNA-binding CsgD family transcriptional regulator